MSSTTDVSKSKKQDEFWKDIINKYVDRNQDLQKEQLALQARVDQMEAAMPAVMAFNMTKLVQDQPDANLAELATLPCICKKDKQEQPMNLVDMSNISVFSIEDPDLHYMQRIKKLTEHEKTLINNVNKLRSKEQAYTKTKMEVNTLVEQPCKDTRIDGNALQQMNERLLCENRKLSDELADLRLEMKHTREHISGPMSRELQRERMKVFEYEAKLQQKINSDATRNKDIQNEILMLSKQLRLADKNLRDVNGINSTLQEEAHILKRRLQELHWELVNQKISEAHTLATLNAIGKTDEEDECPIDCGANTVEKDEA